MELKEILAAIGSKQKGFGKRGEEKLTKEG